MVATSSFADNPVKWLKAAELLAAHSHVAECEALLEVALRLRDEVIRSSRAAGLSQREIAQMVGLSKARVQQIVPALVEDEPVQDDDDDEDPDRALAIQ